MGPGASATSLAATGLSVAGTLFSSSTAATNAMSQGNATGESDAFRAMELQRRASYGEVKANQVDAFMRDNLASSLANILAVRATTGTTSDSPTGNAIMARAEAVGEQARQQRVSNINEQTQEDRDASQFYRNAGLSAIAVGQRNARNIEIAGDLRAGGQLLGGLSGAGGSFGDIGSNISNILADLANPGRGLGGGGLGV